MKVTILQRDILSGDPLRNRLRLEEALSRQEKADLFVIPEMFTTGFCTVDRHGMILCDDGETLSWMQVMAAKLQAAIAGSIAHREGDGYQYNRFYFVDPEGKVWHYDKKHLFTYGHEETYFRAGKERTIVYYKGFRILLQVCYDIRFPVWSRNRKDYDVILYVANWPEARISAWQTLIRARAIENQCYVIGVNRIGHDQATTYNGFSAIIDPYGTTLAECDQPIECEVSAELSKQRLDVFRKRFPVLNDADAFHFD